MLTFIIVFFHFRCLAKNGSGVVQMEPLEASWLVRACVVLHNMCIDWELQALKPEDSYDPEIELDIQQEAAKWFLRSLKQNRDRSVLEVRRRKRDREEYLAGVRLRNDIFHNHFGGPQPQERHFQAIEEAWDAVGEHVGVLVGVLCGELGEELERGVDIKKA